MQPMQPTLDINVPVPQTPRLPVSLAGTRGGQGAAPSGWSRANFYFDVRDEYPAFEAHASHFRIAKSEVARYAVREFLTRYQEGLPDEVLALAAALPRRMAVDTPGSGSIKGTLFMPPDEMEIVKKFAATYRLSLNVLIRLAVREYIPAEFWPAQPQQ